MISFPALGSDYNETPPSASKTGERGSITSEHFVVYYRAGADLKKIERNLNKKGRFSGSTTVYTENDPSIEICLRLDELFNGAVEALSIRPGMGRITIDIFKDRAELEKEYFKISGKKGSAISFYIKEYNTIYTSENDISDSVIIHETAHAVIDNWPPMASAPDKIKEILAAYVDIHF